MFNEKVVTNTVHQAEGSSFDRSVLLVNYKSGMPSMAENGESTVRFGKIFNLMI